MTFAEVCELLRVSEKTGKIWMAAGNFPPAVVLNQGRKATRRWRRGAVERLLEQRERAGN
jgi:predicted site-specific integrase-resolvase